MDPQALKLKFLALSAEVHPDRVHQGTEPERQAAQRRYLQLNEAYQCLRQEKTRLAHLLELELGAKPSELQRIPPALMERSLEISRLCREADVLLGQKAGVTSPLLKVQFFERSQLETEKLLGLQRQLNRWDADLLNELKQIDTTWAATSQSGSPERAATLERLERLYRLFGYSTRWSAQVQERIVQLSF